MKITNCVARMQKYLMAQQGIHAGPGGRSVYGVGLRALTYSDWGFESRRGNRRLSLVNVVYCQVEVHEMRLSLFKSSSTKCGVS